MPLSAAEKQRRYSRERMKNQNPEKYEHQRKKNLNRINSKKKKVSEMSMEEKELQRQKWRAYQNKSRSRKRDRDRLQEETNEETHTSTAKEENKIQKLRTKYRLLVNKFNRYLTYTESYRKLKDCYKKKYQRIQAQTNKKIFEMEESLTKMKAREEILESALQKTYRNCKKHHDKRVLKCLITNSKDKTYTAKLFGLKNIYNDRKRTTKRVNIIQEIRLFYMRDDISRNTAGKKETRTQNKEKHQIRYLLDSLINLYKKYKSEGGRYGFTTFYKQKPYFILSPNINSRETCMCIKHSTLNFLFIALKKHSILKHSINELLKQLVCSPDNYNCMYNSCMECAGRQVEVSNSYENDKEKSVTWFEWERKDHTYVKNEGTEQKLMKTKKMVKSLKTGTIEELFEKFNTCIRSFKKHHFNMVKQIKEYQNAVATLKDNEALIVCDFSENFETKLSEEIQSMHFGASKAQITLHTGMIYWKNNAQSFCSISDNNRHQPSAIWAHLTPILDLIKVKTPDVDTLHFFSDGPSSQYRQKNNFYLHSLFTKKYNMLFSTWSYFESGHGKSAADGIGGCVKRMLDRKACYGIDITNAEDAYTVLKQSVNVKVFLIKEEKVNEITKLLPRDLIPLKGTMSLHQIITTDNPNILKFRDISCFCEPLRGNCACFSTRSHGIRKPNDDNDKENVSLPSTSKRSNSVLVDITPKIDQKVPLKTSTNVFKENMQVEISPRLDITNKDPLAANCDLTIETAVHRIESYTYDSIDLNEIGNVVSDCSKNIDDDLMEIDLMPLVILSDKRTIPSNSKILSTDEEITLNTTNTPYVKPLKPKPVFNKKKGKPVYPESVQGEKHHKCTSILGRKIKCIACKKMFCEECAGGYSFFDFICNTCLQGSDSD